VRTTRTRIVVTLGCLIGAFAVLSASGREQVVAAAPDAADSEQIAHAIERWSAWLSTTFVVGKEPGSEREELSRIARDRATLHHGGSGSYAEYFLVDDFLQVRIEFDRHGRLAVQPIVEHAGRWLKNTDGSLMLVQVTRQSTG
jgi:hypothetical protein